MSNPETWQEFLKRQNEREWGKQKNKYEALESMLREPKSADPNDATNLICDILAKQKR